MKIAVLGTGMVGKTIASKLVAIGHQVRMGSRSPDNAEGRKWLASAGGGASLGTFEDAALFGEVIFNCTNGMGSMDALKAAGAGLDGKIVIDVANVLDFSKGMPPRVLIGPDDSLAEQLQRAFPKARIVKSLNTVNTLVMVDPSRIPGEHDMFVAGNDPLARTAVIGWLRDWFGWKVVHDLGDLTAARALEAWLPMWLRLWGHLRTGDFNLHVVKA